MPLLQLRSCRPRRSRPTHRLRPQRQGGRPCCPGSSPSSPSRAGKKEELQRGPTAGARPGGRGGNTSLTAERGRQPRASSKLFKNEVHAIAYRYFATTLDGKLKSGYLAAALEELIKSRPGVLDAVVLEAEAAGVAAVGAVVAGAAAGVAAAAVAALPPWGGHGGGGGQ